MSHYGKEITITPRSGQGQCNLIYSSKLSLDDAISTIAELKRTTKEKEIEESLLDAIEDTDDLSILHKAAGILRREMDGMENLNKYPEANGLSFISEKH